MLWIAGLIALCAGFVDSVAGGGGLIQLPGLMLLFPNVPYPLLAGTNKLSSASGTTVATFKYARTIGIPRPIFFIGVPIAFAMSYLGSSSISLLNPDRIKPFVCLVLAFVLIYTLANPTIGTQGKPVKLDRRVLVGIGLVTALIGFYDGFIGPGTGSFLIFGFIAVGSFDFLKASASAKAVNLATNIASLVYFISHRSILWDVGLVMAGCNMVGAYIGAHCAIARGNVWIRRISVVVSAGILIKLILSLGS